MLPAFLLLAVVASLHEVACGPYQGSECLGLLEFDLSSSSNVLALDAAVAADLSPFPVYITYRCKAALRKYYCLTTYTPQANSSTLMCASVCQEVLSACGSLLEDAAKDSSFGMYLYDLFNVCANDQPRTNCANGSTGAYFSQDEPQCFYETVVPDEYGGTFLLEPSACAIPCPGNVFHQIYPLWHRLLLVLSVISLVGASATTLSFVKKYRSQRLINGPGISSLRTASVFPVLMFCVGGWIQAVVNCITLIVEISHPTCEGNAKWRSATPMCAVQSVTILGACFWSCCWSFIIAYETWAIVFLAPNPWKRQNTRRRCAVLAVVATFASVLVTHLTSTQVRQVQLPFCIVSSITNVSIPDAVFWIPSTVLVSLSSVMMFSVLFRVRQLDRSTEKFSIVNKEELACKTCSCLRSILTQVSKALLLRIFLLVLCYNFFFLLISYLLYDAQLHNHKYESNAADYYTCLFTYSMTDPELGRAHCGDILQWNISQPLWTFTIYVVIVGCFGLIPFLVFGTDYECRHVSICLKKGESIERTWFNFSPASMKCSTLKPYASVHTHRPMISVQVNPLWQQRAVESSITSVTPASSPRTV